jgi:hypothetical protein
MIDKARQIFARAFRLSSASVRESVVDTGGPHLFAVRVDSCIPDRYTYPQTALVWERIEQRLSAAYGFPVYFDSINACETRCYKVLPIANFLPIP